MRLIKFIIAWFRVPKGPYCYFGSGAPGSKSFRPCPYYRAIWLTKKGEDHISYCRYMDNTNFDFDLYDQCKICGIKDNTDKLIKEIEDE